ncbi:MAG: hypothetical protein LBL35_08320 [Clostridiales bacterium]|jgi:hypothetical protein|nr:hypothetical protein [Clostridiales bacterium]
MDKSFDIKKILNLTDFSQGLEKDVWEKIVSRLPYDVGARSFGELDSASGGISCNMEHKNNPDGL